MADHDPTRRPGSPSYVEARDALDDPHSSAERLLAAGNGLRGAFARYEHGIGLLPADAFDVMLEAYRRADVAGSREAALTWVQHAYVERLDGLAAEAAARVDALTQDDPDGTAHLLRGWMRFNGFGFAQDAPAAVADHEAAAARGNAAGDFELSVLFGTGQGCRSMPSGRCGTCRRPRRRTTRGRSTTWPPATPPVAGWTSTRPGLSGSTCARRSSAMPAPRSPLV
ncbi:hypothetical protein [Nocardioides zeae]